MTTDGLSDLSLINIQNENDSNISSTNAYCKNFFWAGYEMAGR
jgi:hypothetical protein